MQRIIFFGVACVVLLAMVFYNEAASRHHRRETNSIQNDSDVVNVKMAEPLQYETSHSEITTVTNYIADSFQNDSDGRSLNTLKLQSETIDDRNTTAKNDNTEPETEPLDKDWILFPDSPKIVGIPNCAQGNSFCETFEKYPDKQVQQILTSIPDKPAIAAEEDATEARGKLGNNDEIPVCKTLKRTIYPKAGRNKEGKWKYIVNLDQFSQGIPVETCGPQVNAPCEVIGELLNGYTTSCKQKFIYRKMLSLSEDGNSTWDSFSFPSGCYCSIQRRYPFLSDSESPTEPARY